MAKTSGNIRANKDARNFKTDARSLFKKIESGYGRERDYEKYDTKKLQSMYKIAKNYDASEKEQAIVSYNRSANNITKGTYRSIEHSSLSGARAELINVANRAAIYKDREKILYELKRRKQK